MASGECGLLKYFQGHLALVTFVEMRKVSSEHITERKRKQALVVVCLSFFCICRWEVFGCIFIKVLVNLKAHVYGSLAQNWAKAFSKTLLGLTSEMFVLEGMINAHHMNCVLEVLLNFYFSRWVLFFMECSVIYMKQSCIKD